MNKGYIKPLRKSVIYGIFQNLLKYGNEKRGKNWNWDYIVQNEFKMNFWC